MIQFLISQLFVRRNRIMNQSLDAILRQVFLQFIPSYMADDEQMPDVFGIFFRLKRSIIRNRQLNIGIRNAIQISRSEFSSVLVFSVDIIQFDF